MNRELVDRIVAYADRMGFGEMPVPLGICGLSLVRARNVTPLRGDISKPLLCVILQGRKMSRFGDCVISYGAPETLIVSLHVPSFGQVTEATPERPFVGLAVQIDLSLIRTLQAEMEIEHALEAEDERAIAAGAHSPGLVDAMGRLFGVVEEDEVQQRILAPLIVREVHFRALLEGHGGMLRRLARPESHVSRINRVILKLQQDYASSISMNELAELAGMSSSTFHERFKAVTATTPLQFLKDVRLISAQQKLAAGESAVSNVAFEVGYESPTQFSREYARKFGHPPSAERRNAVQMA